MKHEEILNGYHMIAAVSQETVNFQFSQLFKQNVIHKELNLVMADTGIELKAALSSPTVSFSIPDSHRSVLFMLNMPSGTFTYWEGFGQNAKKHTVNFKDWVYAFHVNLDLLAIKQDAIKAGTVVPQIVKDHLEHFSDSMFSIKHLFLDFENADLANYDSNLTRMKFPDDANLTPGQFNQFQQAIENYFTSLKGSDNPYILGYSIESKLTSSKASFVPTGASFSTFDDIHSEGLNALNFLIMTGHADFPTQPNAGIFDKNWITSTDVDGTFVISSQIFWNQWLLPKITKALNIGEPSETVTGWSFAHSSENKRTQKDGVKCISALTKVDGHIKESEHHNANVIYQNAASNTIKIALSGTFSKKYRNDFQCIFDEWMSEESTINWSGVISIAAGNDGQLTLSIELDVPDAKKKTDGNWLGKGDIALIPDNQDILNAIGKSFEENMKSTLNNFEKFLGDLNNRFVLPAGDVFFFKNPQMDDTGNLLLNISYKANH